MDEGSLDDLLLHSHAIISTDSADAARALARDITTARTGCAPTAGRRWTAGRVLIPAGAAPCRDR